MIRVTPFFYAMLTPVFLMVVALFLSSSAQAGGGSGSVLEKSQSIDLYGISPGDNMALKMQGFSVQGEGGDDLRESLSDGRWKEIKQHDDLLEAPRQHSTLWLKGRFYNSGDDYLQRWVEFSPWRLNDVKAWLVDPQSLEVIKRMQTGLNTPLSDREVDTNRAVLPVSLYPGESVMMVVRIYADSRPFLSVNAWDPVDFSVEEVSDRQLHSVLLASILTLCVVLFLKLDVRYALLGIWLLVTFVFESEKEGYISQIILPFLFDYSANLRFTTWILTEALFLTASVYLLGLRQRRWWRGVPPAALSITALFGTLSFVLDGAAIRNLGSVIDLSFSLIWLLMLPAALRIDRQWQYALLGVLSLWWLAANFVLIGYITNLHYTASFASVKIVAEIGVILGLLLIYSRQKRCHEQGLEQQLRASERGQRAELERLVEKRTHELNMALDSARRANEEKTLFLGRISHDLKSPLTSISGYSQLLGAEGGKAGEYARIIYSSATHMNRLIGRLIGYARGALSKGESTTDVHVEAFFSTVRQEAEVLVEKNGNRFFMSVVVEAFPVVRCDETSLRQVVGNLIDNAAKYTRAGVVTLEVGCFPLSESSDKADLVMTLRDSGSGISEKLQERLFEPFSRESKSSEGSGLGLAIVKDLVAAMGGELSLRSEEGVGTEVSVSIPVERGDEAGLIEGATCAPDYLLPRYQADGLCAWVVEDSPPILEHLRSDLGAMGFDVQGFQSGREVVDLLCREGGLPDLVVTDYRLKDASGDEVLMAVRQQREHIPVLLLSATWSVLRDRRDRDDLGYSAFLAKPVDLVEFRREVARVCDLPAVVHSYGGASTMTVVAPDIQRLSEMLELGAVSDILDWCDAFSAAEPGRSRLADEIRTNAERGDLAAIAASIQALL